MRASERLVSQDAGRFPITVCPQTLDELRTLSREHGEAAVTEVRYGAALTWLMKSYPFPDGLSNPLSKSCASIGIMQEHDRCASGWPTWNGADRAPPAIHGLSLDCQREAEQVAAQTLVDWEAAGCPYLDAARIKSAYKYLTSCPAFISKYLGPNSVTAVTNKQDNQ